MVAGITPAILQPNGWHSGKPKYDAYSKL